MVLTSRNADNTVASEASTLVMENNEDEHMEFLQEIRDTFGEINISNFEVPGVEDDDDALSSLDGEEGDGWREDAPLRDDVPIVTDRWNDEETEALMTAVNVNRGAIKFKFVGPGGGRDVKRQGWLDCVGKYKV